MKIFNCVFVIIFSFILNLSLIESLKEIKSVHSRTKRYVAFPEGSSLIMALCMTEQTILPGTIFTEGVNWGIAYNLPNETTYGDDPFGDSSFVKKRRHRRDLYNQFESVLDSMGFDGRSCIYRALCEASRFATKTSTLPEKIVHLLFKFPQQTLSPFEPEDHRLYHWAYRRGKQSKEQECATMYPECSISLIGLALNYNQYIKEMFS